MLFWIIISLSLLLLVTLLLKPWTSGRAQAGEGTEDRLRISLYQQNLRELDREFERGLLTREQLTNVRSELELSLLADYERDQVLTAGKAPLESPASRWSVAVPVIAIMLMAIPLYLYLGNPQLIPLKHFSELAAQNNGDSAPPLDGVAPALETHLRKNPQDANGWMLLADVYTNLKQYPEAINAFDRLLALTGDNVEVLLRYANLQVMINNGKFGGKPAELVKRVLAIEPENYTALFFSGMAADEAGEYQQAIQYYRKLLPAMQGNEDMLKTVNDLIARNEQLLKDAGISVEAPAVTETPAAADAVAVALHVSVSVAESLAGKYSAEDTLYIYAQAVEGPPMPLAVIKKTAASLPLEVILDDSLAMMPAMKLSRFDKVKLQARISKSGNAQPEPGDLHGEIAEVSVGTTDTLNLIISEVMP